MSDRISLNELFNSYSTSVACAALDSAAFSYYKPTMTETQKIMWIKTSNILTAFETMELEHHYINESPNGFSMSDEVLGWIVNFIFNVNPPAAMHNWTLYKKWKETDQATTQLLRELFKNDRPHVFTDEDVRIIYHDANDLVKYINDIFLQGNDYVLEITDFYYGITDSTLNKVNLFCRSAKNIPRAIVPLLYGRLCGYSEPLSNTDKMSERIDDFVDSIGI